MPGNTRVRADGSGGRGGGGCCASHRITATSAGVRGKLGGRCLQRSGEDNAKRLRIGFTRSSQCRKVALFPLFLSRESRKVEADSETGRGRDNETDGQTDREPRCFYPRYLLPHNLFFAERQRKNHPHIQTNFRFFKHAVAIVFDLLYQQAASPRHKENKNPPSVPYVQCEYCGVPNRPFTPPGLRPK